MGIIISILSYVTKIFQKVSGMASGSYPVTRSNQSGQITLTGQEQTLYQKFDANAPFNFAGGSINLSTLQNPDIVLVKMYVCNAPEGTWNLTGQLRLAGWKVASNPVLEFSPSFNQYGIRVSMVQYVGSYRTITHEWFDGSKLA